MLTQFAMQENLDILCLSSSNADRHTLTGAGQRNQMFGYRRLCGEMRYRFTLQERDSSWVYVLCFGKDTPTAIEDVVAYSDNCVSAEDAHRVRHYVYSKAGKLVSIHLHDALRLLPYLNPDRPETVRMPGMQAMMFGNPPVPTLFLQFREEPPDNRNAYALSPNVFLIFQGGALAQMYVTDVYATIADMADEAGAPPPSAPAKRPWWKFW